MSSVCIALITEPEQSSQLLLFFCTLLWDRIWTPRLYQGAGELANALKRENYSLAFVDAQKITPKGLEYFDQQEGLMLFVIGTSRLEELEASFHVLERTHLPEQLESFRDLIRQHLLQKDSYLLKIGKAIYRLSYQDIYYLEKRDKQVLFHTRVGDFAKRTSLYPLVEHFESYGFIQCHSSFLVNRFCITAMEPDQLEIRHDCWVPIARARRGQVQALLENEIS